MRAKDRADRRRKEETPIGAVIAVAIVFVLSWAWVLSWLIGD